MFRASMGDPKDSEYHAIAQVGVATNAVSTPMSHAEPAIDSTHRDEIATWA